MVSRVTQTDAERKQIAAQQEAQNKPEQEQPKKELVTDKKEAEQEHEKPKTESKPKLSKAKIVEARRAVQKFIDEGIFIKIDGVSDDGKYADVWTDTKFGMLPFDMKTGAVDWVYLAYCSNTPDGFIRIIDGYTGKKIDVYTLRSSLELD